MSNQSSNEQFVLLVAENVVTKNHVMSPGYVLVDTISGKISKISQDKNEFSGIPTLHVPTKYLLPGYVDIHIHGLGGTDTVENYWKSDFTEKKLASRGTTSCIASITFPGDISSVLDVVNVIKEKCTKVIPGHAVIEGIHAEGPIISTCGGLPTDGDFDMEISKFTELVDKMLPSLKIMTISPSREKPREYKRLKVLLEKGVIPALGHDKSAKEEDILGAFVVARDFCNSKQRLHVTHMFNVSDFHHRDVSLVNFGILREFPNLEKFRNLQPPTIEIIGDFVHVHPMAVMAALQGKGYDDIAFITDAIMDKDTKEGAQVTYSGRAITRSNNCVVLPESNTIAGSCCDQHTILKNLVTSLNVPLEKASKMLSGNPAEIAKLDHVGSIEVGKRADILFLDENLDISCVMIAGKIAWKKS